VFPGLAESRIILGLAVAAWGGAAAPVVAQARSEDREGPLWTLDGLRAGQCVRFLIDPKVARRALPDDARLLPASRDEILHPALRGVIGEQPEFATWTPSSLCVFYGDSLNLGGRRFANKDPSKWQMIGLWIVASSGQGGGARRDVVVTFFGAGGRVAQAGGYATKVRFKEAKSSVSKVPDTDNDLYNVRIGKTRLVWNGRPAGDSLRIEQPIQESWLAQSSTGVGWRVQATLKPEWSRLLVGVLSVEGKDDLAKALKASPIRFVGPVYQGGGLQVRFSR
jgi:hypothetical protein